MDVYKEVEKIYKENPDRIKAIGVSNWSVSYLERLLQYATVIPAINQIELHPSCTQTELVEFSKSKGVAITAHSPLGSTGTPLARGDVVRKVAGKKGVSPFTVLVSLRANTDQTNVLCKSVTAERIRCGCFSQFLRRKGLILWLITSHDVANTELVEELLAIDKTFHFRCCHPDWTGYGSLGFPDCE